MLILVLSILFKWMNNKWFWFISIYLMWRNDRCMYILFLVFIYVWFFDDLINLVKVFDI